MHCINIIFVKQGCPKSNCGFFIQSALIICLTACDYLIVFFLLTFISCHYQLALEKSARNFVYICLSGANFNMAATKEHFRHSLYYYFLKGKTAEQVAKKLRNVYGDKDSVKIGFANSVLEIFHLKMSHVQVGQMKLMTKSKH